MKISLTMDLNYSGQLHSLYKLGRLVLSLHIRCSAQGPPRSVLWELITGEQPYSDLDYDTVIGCVLCNTLRPPVPYYCDPAWRSLMERCWSHMLSERPSFAEIALELCAMIA
ncbi:hypothetical protein Nepgr_010001 [Nepenthes gracilis]|uniref:Serine-threonine/tyrosine-protein kinase catalytic domain-containing protein n=1 Tax=Nepenthes gracilis TaxID=150966 RepID=A0AAD3XKZ1_NEPGR|nr:hypothetical protein Nepgr_010001 [Nepenthes gracilis]